MHPSKQKPLPVIRDGWMPHPKHGPLNPFFWDIKYDLEARYSHILFLPQQLAAIKKQFIMDSMTFMAPIYCPIQPQVFLEHWKWRMYILLDASSREAQTVTFQWEPMSHKNWELSVPSGGQAFHVAMHRDLC